LNIAFDFRVLFSSQVAKDFGTVRSKFVFRKRYRIKNILISSCR
jgi:hypothetical protein